MLLRSATLANLRPHRMAFVGAFMALVIAAAIVPVLEPGYLS